MLLCVVSYPHDGRKCRYFINGLVKSGMVLSVKRINYVKSYYMHEGDMKAENEKILLLKLTSENKPKVVGYIHKNHPHESPEMIWLNPADIDQ